MLCDCGHKTKFDSIYNAKIMTNVPKCFSVNTKLNLTNYPYLGILWEKNYSQMKLSNNES